MNKILLLCALFLAAFAPPPARAAECTEIGSVGTLISAPGSYCLGSNLTAGLTSGSFIEIGANDVTLDCRGYTLRNSNTASTGGTYGVWIVNRRNVHVRNCRIEGGFAAGIYAYQDNGLANQNRNLHFTGNTISGAFWFGIHAYGTDIFIRDNTLLDIGGRASFAMGIRVGGSIVQGESRYYVIEDNVIHDVASPVNNAFGIYANNGDRGVVRNNMVTATIGAPTFFGYGIRLIGTGAMKLTGNHVVGVENGSEGGIDATSSDTCFDNYVRDVLYPYLDCDQALGNY